MAIILSTGLFHVVSDDGQWPFWVEARTYNKAPLVGEDVRVRGYDTLERASRLMRRLTREALAADKTLKRFLTSLDGTLPDVAPTKRPRGRPAGAKNKPRKAKPGPKPKAKDPIFNHPFSSTRFVMVPDVSNPVAQVWVCNSDTARPRGRAARMGANRLGDLPHLHGSYAVTRLLAGKLYCALDHNNQPQIYPNWMTAERDAIHFWEITPEPKYGLDSPIFYSNGTVAVHLKAGAASTGRPFTLFDHRTGWVMGEDREGVWFRRLDRAIEAADLYAEKTFEPASVRLINALSESPEEKAERELKEAEIASQIARRDAWQRKVYEEDQRELAAIARRSEQEALKRGRRRAEAHEIPQRRKATPDEIAAARFRALPGKIISHDE